MIETPTDAPRAGPTMLPTFDMNEFARDSSHHYNPLLSPDAVLDLVPNVSWSFENLDIVELNIVRHIDGVTPVALLESLIGLPREEFHATLVMLFARQLLIVVGGESTSTSSASKGRSPFSSGVFSPGSLGLLAEGDEDLEATG